MANFNQRISEGVCIDEEVFFGPITDKERKIKETFENNYKRENKTSDELQKVVENDVSMNDSLYVSFSVDGSKYDSFDDSLSEEVDKKLPETKHVLLRKSFDKLKQKKHAFYDSLEDVCSLASNIEKCSISCDAENDSDLNNKLHIIEDSLQNPQVVITNKNYCANEQVHFDDDSLAIAEFENTFDDSLEDFNVLSSIEIEEINDAEMMITENHNIASKADQYPVCSTRNLFETSVQIIYEKKESDVGDREDSSGDKNIFYDSLSNSDFKDILKDSLEESEKYSDNLLKCMPDMPAVNNEKLEKPIPVPGIKIEEINNQKSVIVKHQLDQSPNFIPKSSLETSVLIIEQKSDKTHENDQELQNDKIALDDSLLNSDIKDILIDSCEESEKYNDLKHSSNVSNISPENFEQMFVNPGTLDNSVQIVYENLQNFYHNENVSNDNSNFKCNTISQEILKNNDQRMDKTACNNNILQLQPFCVKSDKSVTKDSEKTAYNDPNMYQNCKENEDKLPTVITDQNFPLSVAENSNFSNEAFTVDSCHLKCSNENLNVVKDLKFQHFEVTVSDKKCKIASEDIKLLHANNLNSKINQSSPSTLVPFELESSTKEEKADVLDFCDSKLNSENETCNINVENISCEDSNENNSINKFNREDTANITQRTKSSFFKQLGDSDMKFSSLENVNDGNLLQALDLHDISVSFLNESIAPPNDPAVPTHLYSREQGAKKRQTYSFRSESKENIAESVNNFEEKNFCSSSKDGKIELNYNKSPKCLQKSPSFKDPAKKTPGTKIPVRKVENFVVPAITPSKQVKQVPSTQSAEKAKQHIHANPCHSAEKKPFFTTPQKIPHICKVRNTIFSKVPQITPSKKYMNIQSPVAQYIRNTPSSAKTPVIDPVLQDCMNHLHMHQQLESPSHLYQTKSGSAKSKKRKA